MDTRDDIILFIYVNLGGKRCTLAILSLLILYLSMVMLCALFFSPELHLICVRVLAHNG